MPCVLQRAWRCFYARVTLFYLKQHKKYVKLALKESNVTRIGSMVVPRKLVRQHLKCVFSHSSDCRVRPAVTVECIMDFPLLVVDVSSHGPINWQRLVSLHLNLCRSWPAGTCSGGQEIGLCCCARYAASALAFASTEGGGGIAGCVGVGRGFLPWAAVLALSVAAAPSSPS